VLPPPSVRGALFHPLLCPRALIHLDHDSHAISDPANLRDRRVRFRRALSGITATLSSLFRIPSGCTRHDAHLVSASFRTTYLPTSNSAFFSSFVFLYIFFRTTVVLTHHFPLGPWLSRF
jgi:hypothetical protein